MPIDKKSSEKTLGWSDIKSGTIMLYIFMQLRLVSG